MSSNRQELIQLALGQHDETIKGQAQEIEVLRGQLDSCEEQFQELEKDSAQRLTEKEDIIRSLRGELQLKSGLIEQLKGELSTRDEKYNSLLKAFENFGSLVKASILQLAGTPVISLLRMLC